MINDDELRRIEADWAGHPHRSDVDYLIAEVRELRLILRDAVQDSTPGNRVWREGVKAGLEAAAKVANEAKESEMVQTAERATAWYACDMIRGLISAIDPSTILPAP